MQQYIAHLFGIKIRDQMDRQIDTRPAYAHDKRGFQVSGAVDWNGPLYVQLKQTVVV